MDIKEFKEKRAQLERDICAATQKLVDDFVRETTLQVTDISIDVHCSETIGAPSRSIISEVEVRIDI